jgi:hypothetical protein
MNEMEQMIRDIRVALQEKASILNTLGECAPVQLWAKDLNHRYIYANSLHLEWLGVSEAAGLTDRQIAIRNRTLSSDPKFHTFGEVCVLRQKAVAWMNGFRARDLRGTDDCRNVQVALAGGRWADAHRLISEADMLQVTVCRRIYGNRLDAHVAAAPHDSQRDLATIGDQDLLYRGNHQ